MRRPSDYRSRTLRSVAIVAALLVPVLGIALWVVRVSIRDAFADEVDEGLAAQRQSLQRTSRLLEDTIDDHEQALRRRARAFYKLHRSTWPRMWMEPETRPQAVRILGAARRVVARDLRELGFIRAELADSDSALSDLEQQMERRLPDLPDKGSLYRPIAGSVIGAFGDYKDQATGAQLYRRGVELRAAQGRSVHAPASGLVRYVGEVSGLGLGAILDHGSYWTVLAPLQDVMIARGQRVERAQAFAQAAEARLYFELRLESARSGVVVDPTRLLAR